MSKRETNRKADCLNKGVKKHQNVEQTKRSETKMCLNRFLRMEIGKTLVLLKLE
jgi:hypothetical protein